MDRCKLMHREKQLHPCPTRGALVGSRGRGEQQPVGGEGEVHTHMG